MSLSADVHYVPNPPERIYDEIPSPDCDGDNNLYNGSEMNDGKKSVQEEIEPSWVSSVGPRPNLLSPIAQEDDFNVQAASGETSSENEFQLLDDFNWLEYMKDQIDIAELPDAGSTNVLPLNTLDKEYATAVEDTDTETTQINSTASTVDVSETASLVTVSISSAPVPVAESNTVATVISTEYGRRESRCRKSSLGSRRVSEEVKETSPTNPGRGEQKTQRPRRTTTKRKRADSPEILQSSNDRCHNKRMWEMNIPEAKNAKLAKRRREEQKAKMEKAEADIKILMEEKMELQVENEALKKQVLELLKFKEAHELSQTHSTTMMKIIEGLRPVVELLKELPAPTRDANNM